MRRLGLIFLAALLVAAACAKSPTAAGKPAGDPYSIVGVAYESGLYPDTARVAMYVHYVGVRNDVDSLHDTYGILKNLCGEVYTGSGFITDNVITVEWVITAGADTLGRYIAAPFDPLQSPIGGGWGDDPQHVLRWFLRINSLTPRAPTTATFVAGPGTGLSYNAGAIPQADYCAP